MFWKKKFNLDKFIEKYEQAHDKPLVLGKLMGTFPRDTHNYKKELLNLIDDSIRTKDSDKLGLYLSLAWRDGMDDSYKPVLKAVILATWHSFHEDIVDYAADLKDDAFTDDIYTIATNSFYRQYDDENDATLRKCIYALKAINSEEAKEKIQLLKDTGNINVKYALENVQSLITPYKYYKRPGYGTEKLLLEFILESPETKIENDLLSTLKDINPKIDSIIDLWMNDEVLFKISSDKGSFLLSKDIWGFAFIMADENQPVIECIDEILKNNSLFERQEVDFEKYRSFKK